jgi:hypothetical protein
VVPALPKVRSSAARNSKPRSWVSIPFEPSKIRRGAGRAPSRRMVVTDSGVATVSKWLPQVTWERINRDKDHVIETTNRVTIPSPRRCSPRLRASYPWFLASVAPTVTATNSFDHFCDSNRVHWTAISSDEMPGSDRAWPAFDTMIRLAGHNLMAETRADHIEPAFAR